MRRVEKTIFISYRRTNSPWALAIYQNLTFHGFDVFFDYRSIASGDFEQIIIENIKARAHFIVLLTPSALERCDDPSDWLRREIEVALQTKRNIVPIMLEGFDFSSTTVSNQLVGQLEALKKYNGLTVPVEYFDEAMKRLREYYLNIPLSAVLHPLSEKSKVATQVQQIAASAAPKVEDRELTAQQWFERGVENYYKKNYEDAVNAYNKAIQLRPNNPDIYGNRGVARFDSGDFEGAIQDYKDAIRINPNDPKAYFNLGHVLESKNDLEGAILAYTNSIRADPDFAEAYNNRGLVREIKGDLDGAINDYSQAIRLKSDNAHVYTNRGNVYLFKGEFERALLDFDEAIRLKPDLFAPNLNRGVVFSRRDEVDKAISAYSKAIHLEPEIAQTYFDRALLWEKKGDYYAALADYRKYLELGGGIYEYSEVMQKIRALEEKL